MDRSQLTRRRFVVSVIALAAATGSILRPGSSAISRALADFASPLDEAVRGPMVRMSRLLFPHDELADDVYEEILDKALSDVAGSDKFAAHLEAAATALAQQSGVPWQTLDEAAQLDAMRNIEAEPFFKAIQNHVRLGVYNSAAFWNHIGYPGPSKGFGGYLHRGAGDIDWLPEDK